MDLSGNISFFRQVQKAMSVGCYCLILIHFVYVVVQFHPWFKFHFLLFLGMVMYDNDFETKENKI